MINFQSELLEKITRDLGIIIPVVIDYSNIGNIQRFSTEKTNDNAGWLIINTWEYKGNYNYSAVYGSFRKAVQYNFSSNKRKDKLIVKAEKRAIDELRLKAEEEKKEKHEKCATHWNSIFNQLPINSATHGYLENKKINSNYRARIDTNGVLYIPIYQKHGFVGVQRIFFSLETNKYEKKYAFGINMAGSFCPFGSYEDIENADFVYLTEGYATAATVYEVTNTPVICCFQANNIERACNEIRELFPNKKICIAADNDESKTGEKQAKFACKNLLNVIYKLPEFEHKTPNLSDFNDLLVVTDFDTTLDQLHIYDASNFDLERFKIDIKNQFLKFSDDAGKFVKDYDRLAEFFHTKFKNIRMTDIKKTMVFDGKIYKFMNDEEIGQFSLRYFNKATTKDIDEFTKKIRYFSQSKYEKFSSQQDGYINFINGVYDIHEKVLLPHSHDFKFQYMIPVKYDPKATCETWDLLLRNVTLDRIELQDIINEFMGMTLSNISYEKFNSALILDGTGSNGKTTLLNAMRSVLSGPNISNVSMGEMSQNRFLSYELVNKLINVSEEEEVSVFSKTGMFKKLTGNTPIHVEKKREQGFSFTSRAKIIMTYNEMPYLADKSKGMLRRLLIIPFEMNTKHDSDRVIKDVIDKIKQEKSGIVNRWIEHFHNLINRGMFTDSFLVQNRVNKLMISSDSVLDFFAENIEIDRDNEKWFIPLKVLYEKFQDESGKINKTGRRTFSNKIKDYFSLETVQARWSTHSSITKDNCKGFKGIRFKKSSIYFEQSGYSE